MRSILYREKFLKFMFDLTIHNCVNLLNSLKLKIPIYFEIKQQHNLNDIINHPILRKNPSIIVCLLNVFKKEFPEQSNAYNNYKFICKIWDSFPKITVRLFPINYLSGNNLFAGF